MKPSTKRGQDVTSSKGRSPVPPSSSPLIVTGRIMTHRLGDFLFDGAALALEGIPEPVPHTASAADLAPVTSFYGRDDLLSSAILLKKSAAPPETQTAYARWQNQVATPLVPPPQEPKGFVLVEEARLAELTRFESTMQREKELIARQTNGREQSLSIFEHDRIDPRVPSDSVRRAMRDMSAARCKFLAAEWATLHTNWARHAAHFSFNTPYVYRDYADASDAKLGAELRNPGASWLLKAAPGHMQEKKMKMVKQASETFRLRRDRDTMLFEDDRSFLCQQMFEATTRALDYDRYCSLALLFGPMPPEQWCRAKSRPGLQYFVRATANALTIQRCWNVFWTLHKLRRYRAARRVQAKFRAWYGYKSLHPLVILRLRFGKRTYYFYCWARWQQYNKLVKAIAARLELMRTRWARMCFANWKGFAFAKGEKKRQILATFRRRFDTRSACLLRMALFRDKSRRIKLWLRTTWNLPQWIVWKEYVVSQKRLKALSRVIVPVQAFIRMVQRRRFFLRLKAVRPVFLKFVFMLHCKTATRKAREEAVLVKFVTWGPEETARRAAVKTENERRRQLREQQVAEDRAAGALAELKKHLRSGNGRTQLRIQTVLYRRTHKLSGAKATVAAESELLGKCFSCNVDLQVFEYRTTNPPFIVCADPTCKLTFASGEEYMRHTADMAKDDEPGTSEEVKAARRGSAVLMKAVSMKKAEQAANLHANDKKKNKKKKAAAASGKYAPVAAADIEVDQNVREHSMVDFAELHLLLRNPVGLEGCRNFLARKFGIGVLVHTLDAWSEIQIWRSISVSSDNFVKRALSIYENFIRPGGTRPVLIDLDDGDMRDDLDEGEGPGWLALLLAKLDAVKNREFEGFYQASRHKFWYHRLLGLRGRRVQSWTDHRMLTSDVFDGFEWACFLSLHRALWADQDQAGQFLRSREKQRYDASVAELAVRVQASLLEDCRVARKQDIVTWCADFRTDEMRMAAEALVAADALLEQEVGRLASRAAVVWARETLFRIQHDEQSSHEAKAAMCDDAVDWAADDLMDHVFDFYVPRLLDTMLGYEEMVEGLMEYAGMLKNKKLKKRLEVNVAPVGVREDLSWFKEALRASVAEDLKKTPKDFMGAVRLVQRRARGILGRNKARAVFITIWAKKWDPENERFYYVDQQHGQLSWERPAFFTHLFPKVGW